MSRICERCGDCTATQMVSGEDLCVDCANRQSKLNAAERKASSHGIDYSELALGVEERDAELARLRAACRKNDNDIEQVLGRALGYPRYCDDQTNFPGSTDADGVCVGDQVAASLAMQASDLVAQLRADLAEARADVQRFEAALDVSQRELAQARADVAALARSYLKPYARELGANQRKDHVRARPVGRAAGRWGMSKKRTYKMWMVIDKSGSPHAYTCSFQRKQAKWHLTHNLWGASWDEYAKLGYRVVKVDVSIQAEQAGKE